MPFELIPETVLDQEVLARQPAHRWHDVERQIDELRGV
jgi:hypothetical protein